MRRGGAAVARLPVVAFVALAAATVAAFFLTQHLKVSTPLVNGFPAPVPSTINPVSGGTCRLRNSHGRRVPVSFRRMRISFYLQNRGDVVIVSIVNSAGQVVATLPGSGRYMPTQQRRQFVWNGREASGRVAPDGVYDIRVSLVHQDRSLIIAKGSGAVEPVTVQVHPPRLAVTGVTPAVVADPGRSAVTIRFTGNQGLRPQVLILRGGRVVKRFAATRKAGSSLWDGTLVGGRPAPPGRYLIGLRLSPDRTCNTRTSALTPARAPQAVVTVR